MIRTLRVAVCMLTASVSVGAPPDPPWVHTEQPCRLYFNRETTVADYTIVSAPVDDTVPADAPLAAYDAAGKPLACRMLHAGSRQIEVLVRTADGGKDPGTCVLYYGAKQGTERSPEASPDPQPIRLAVHRLQGMSIPNTWEKMLYLYLQESSRTPDTRVARLGTVEISPVSEGKKHHGDRGPPRRIARLRTYVLCPKDGTYTFAVRTDESTFVVVGREVVVSRPDRYPSDTWHLGKPVTLAGGVHQVDILTCCRATARLELGWIPPNGKPGDSGFEADPRKAVAVPGERFVASDHATTVRLEMRDRSLHPGFTARLLPAYRFRDRPEVFVPVTLTSTSKNWAGQPITCTWSFPGTERPSQTSKLSVLEHLFVGEAEHPVALDVVDDRGTAGRWEQTVDTRLVRVTEYASEVEAVAIPSVVFETDILEPYLRVVGKLPPGRKVALSWTVNRRSGEVKRGSLEVVPEPQADFLPVTRETVGDIHSFEWTARHAGVVLRSETVRFIDPPFTPGPVRVHGDRLFGADGTHVVLQPYRYADEFQQAPLDPGVAAGHILCVDDMFACPSLPRPEGLVPYDRLLAGLLDDVRAPDVVHRPLACHDEGSSRYAPLEKFVQAAAIAREKPSVVILSIGLADLLNGLTVDEFERHASAFTDQLAIAHGIPVVWVTPPPCLDAGGRMTDYAAAIRRVADARNIPVADVYTAYWGLAGTSGVRLNDRDLVLSQAGHDIIARTIVRVLQGPAYSRRTRADEGSTAGSGY